MDLFMANKLTNLSKNNPLTKPISGNPHQSENPSRRTFLKCSLAGGALMVSAIHIPAAARTGSNESHTAKPVRFPLLAIHADNSMTLFNCRSEMGQGATTIQAQYLLDELDADWSLLKQVEQAGADPQQFGPQNTIGAISSFLGWKFHRDAGAQLRQLLVNQAMAIWQVDAESLYTQNSYIYHRPTGQKLSYGELAGLLKDTTLPEKFTRKTPEQYTQIGRSVKRLDMAEKVDGRAKFGIDVSLPDMKTAVLIRPPVAGSQLISFDAKSVKQQKGVLDTFSIPQGVVIVADNYWHASLARKVANPVWNNSDFSNSSSHSLMQTFRGQLDTPAQKHNERGDFSTQLANAASEQRFELHFEFPFITHVTMEPMNCVAWQTESQLQIWAPTQNRNNAKQKLQELFELTPEAIDFNTTLMGGGFGRRAQEDFVVEAATIARQVSYPVKVIWSREDDIQHGFYRPLNAQKVSASVDDKGQLQAWQHNVASLSTKAWHFSLEERDTDGGDWIAYGGAEISLYQSEHFSCGVTLNKAPLHTGILRGISHGYTNFSREVVMEELAKKHKLHPLQYRQRHTDNERALPVLTKLRKACEPYEQQPNRKLGYAFGFEKAPKGPYQYYNAAAFVLTRSNNIWKPEKLILVLDHGTIINPDGLLSQVEGASIFALGMLLHNKITIEKGQVQQTNYHDYPLPRFGSQIPIELHTIESDAWPMGVGEKLQGTIQPAIANALTSISGHPITQLPISAEILQQHQIALD